MPGARPLLCLLAGWTMSARRRPFAGRGTAARRSISASIASLGMTTAGHSAALFGRWPDWSRNCAVLMSGSLLHARGHFPRKTRLGGDALGERAAQPARGGAPVNLDAKCQVGNPHAHGLEECEVGTGGPLGPRRDHGREGLDPSPGLLVLAEPLKKLAAELAHLRHIVHGDDGAAIEECWLELEALGHDGADRVDVGTLRHHAGI